MTIMGLNQKMEASRRIRHYQILLYSRDKALEACLASHPIQWNLLVQPLLFVIDPPILVRFRYDVTSKTYRQGQRIWDTLILLSRHTLPFGLSHTTILSTNIVLHNEEYWRIYQLM